MPLITIAGTPIQFPDVSADPNWAPAIIEFAQAVATALSGFTGPFDVAPQTYAMTADSNPTKVDLPNLTFPTSDVRAVFIQYSVFRTSTAGTVYEGGDIIATYSPANPVGNKWDFIQRRNGNGLVNISISDAGQVEFTSVAIGDPTPGTGHVGTFTYTARALTQT